MKQERDFGMEAAARVRSASKNRNWADAFDRDAIAVNLGDLRGYFSETMLRARTPQQKQALVHHLQRAYARMTVCDIAEKRQLEEESIIRVSLESMANALREGKPEMFPLAKRFAGIVRELHGYELFQEGKLACYTVIASVLADENSVCGVEDMECLAVLVELAAQAPARGMEYDDEFVEWYRAFCGRLSHRKDRMQER